MLSLDLVILLLASVVNIITGLFIYIKNPKSLTNRLFAMLTFTLVGWTSANYISIASTDPDTIFHAVLAILVFVAMQNACFFLFVSTYPQDYLSLGKRAAKIYLAFSVLTIILGINPGFFASYTETADSIRPVPSLFIVLFIIHTIVSIGWGITRLTQRYINSKGIYRNKFKFLFIASAALLLIAPFANFVLPIAFNVKSFIRFSPIYTLAFAGIIAYAIVAQKLFDIRAAVARSVAYILLVVTLATTYAMTLYGGINLVFTGPQKEVLRQVLSIILVIPLVLGFQTIKNFFDRTTNHLFFKNAYDTQTVLDDLGSAIVSEIDLRKILSNTRNILSDAVKATFIEFVLFRDEKIHTELLNNKNLLINLDNITTHLNNHRGDILVTDEMNRQSPLRNVLEKDSVAVTLRLKTHHQIVGYIFFSEKSSGDIYNKQDLKLFSIVENELAVAIQNALRFEEIQKFNITLQQKVDEATRQLRRTNEKLKALDETKDEFISMASHQLRTPLTSVKGYVSMVLEGDAGKINDMQRKLLDQAFVSSQRMVYLIADLLNVSRLKTGKFVIEPKPTNLADVVEGELSQLIETAKSRNLELTFKKPEHFPLLMLDETKTRQVVMNFVDNAIYYTPSGGHIYVNLVENGDMVEFTVVDDGLGVPKADQHHLFTKFYRAGNAKKARPDGTGLGLFMAKKVIVAQGGAIIFRSQEGKGSTFGFSFSKSKLKVPEHLKAGPAKSTQLSEIS